MKHDMKMLRNSQQLRRNMTKEERHLWYDFLREYPIQFKRQEIIGRYITDFYCHRAKLVVELDGSQHYEAKNIEYDKKRAEALEQQGLYVMRISNSEITENFRGVCEAIDLMVSARVFG